jgi:hypothetical protein
MPSDRWAIEVCAHVAGLDIHPVAIIIARVTYLLALTPALASRSGTLSIPVYLGDSLQLAISEFLAGKELSIRVPPSPAGDNKSGQKNVDGRDQLDFPETFCRDPELFDKAVERMRTGSEEKMTRQQIEASLRRITEQHNRGDITAEQKLAIEDLGKTYVTFDRLRRSGRDSVWAYVARNLSRPLAYSAGGGWAHVVIGNPPWLAFRYMSSVMQKRFKELAIREKVYVPRVPSHNDLCALFAVRAAHLYLRSGGRLSLVLPLAALTRNQFERLRKGSFSSVRMAWDEVWTMDDSVAPLFPVPSCVVFGRRRATAQPLPDTVRAYSGTLPYRDAPESVADRALKVVKNAPALQVAQNRGGSVYRTSFRQGAILVPRVFCFVERKVSGRLGVNPSAPLVVSRRSKQEKKPWRRVDDIENVVEAEFLRSALLGESIVPYRVLRKFEAVVPVAEDGSLLDAEAAANRGLVGLHGWLRKAERVWNQYNKSSRKLVEQLNYINQLSSQFPIAGLRVVYAKAGSLPAACVLRDDRAVIDHKLYWSAPATESEAHFLTAILNSETARARAAQYQSRGQFGARDFDKVMFNLPIPRFDDREPLHQSLVQAARRAEEIANQVELSAKLPFQRARRLVRAALAEAGVSLEIDGLVAELLNGTS